jgi:hypothetical protein
MVLELKILIYCSVTEINVLQRHHAELNYFSLYSLNVQYTGCFKNTWHNLRNVYLLCSLCQHIRKCLAAPLKGMTLSFLHYLTVSVPYIHFLPECRSHLDVSLLLEDDSKILACSVLYENLP